MLNENLLDSKDIMIAKLKLAIKEFQEYDVRNTIVMLQWSLEN